MTDISTYDPMTEQQIDNPVGRGSNRAKRDNVAFGNSPQGERSE
ncbi:MAG: hypothetical protein ACRBB4_02845 [Neptuniibacter sp.]